MPVRMAILVSLCALTACPGGGSGEGSSGGGSAGASPGAPSPENRAPTFARAAAVIGSCMPDDGVNRNLANLWQSGDIPQLWGRYAQQAGCLATAGGGCDAVEECLGYRLELSTNCVSGCRDSVFTYCEDDVAASFDCAKIGLRCDDAAACTDGSSSACDDQSHVATCEGEEPLTCNDGSTHRGPDCAALGLRCVDGACRGTGAACQVRSSSSEYRVDYVGMACEGDVLRACVAGAEHALDCAAIAPGFSCREADGVYFCGLAAECVPGNLTNYEQSGTLLGCEGDTLAFCNAGRIDRIDCKDLGFERCDPENDGICAPNIVSELLGQP